MMGSLRTWLEALSSREKILVSILLVLLISTIAFYGVFRPISGAMENAEHRYQESIDRQARIEAKVSLFNKADSEMAATANGFSGSLESHVSQSAGEAGFATQAINAQSDGSVTVTISSAKPKALFRWIALLEQRGIMAPEISATPGPNKTISATLQLR